MTNDRAAGLGGSRLDREVIRSVRWSQVVVATLYRLRGEVCDGEQETAPPIHCGGKRAGLGSLAAR